LLLQLRLTIYIQSCNDRILGIGYLVVNEIHDTAVYTISSFELLLIGLMQYSDFEQICDIDC